MHITINNLAYSPDPGTDIARLRAECGCNGALALINGVPCPDTAPIQDGDRIVFISAAAAHTPDDFNAVLAERHGSATQQRLRGVCVGVAGVGGLGSNVCLALVRAGVGHLIIADHDVVELSNLHRQQYFVAQIGIPKVEALAETLYHINPYLKLDIHPARVSSANCIRMFADADILVEAFDVAEAKAELVQSWMQHHPKRPLVSASGMAGFGSANSIVTRNPFANLYVCGDGTSDVEHCGSLCAARVAVAASHQAHAVIRLLLGLNPVKDALKDIDF
ncbi:MAG: sulfur carrier protein ThiS adenylyltransferase ThiF [Thermodesulfobacteriota bacterium]